MVFSAVDSMTHVSQRKSDFTMIKSPPIPLGDMKNGDGIVCSFDPATPGGTKRVSHRDSFLFL